MVKSKKMISLLTAVTAFGTMLASALPTSAAEVYEYKIVNADSYKLTNSTNVRVSANSTIKGGKAWEAVFYSDGTPCYSLEAGLSAKSSRSRRDNLVYDAVTANKLKLSEVQQQELQSVLLYGYTETPKNINNFSDYMPKYIATQLLVWEVVSGQRSNDYRWSDDKWSMHRNFNTKSNGYTAVSTLLNNFSDKQLGKKVRECYNSYEKAIKNDGKKITFAADKQTKADTYSTELVTYKNWFKLDSGNYTFYDFKHQPEKYSTLGVYTDINNQLDNFDVTVSNGKVVSRSAGKLNVKANAKAEAEIKFTSRTNDKCGLLLLDGNKASEAAIVVPQNMKREYFTYVVGAEKENKKDNILLGDVDLNGEVGMADVLLLGKHNLSPKLYPLGKGDPESEALAKKQADMNGDGKIDSLDVSLLNNYVMGKK